MGNVKRKLAKLFEASLKATVPNVPDVEPLVAVCTAKFGDYQWYYTRLYDENICDFLVIGFAYQCF